ncbi:MAG TPA: GerMN domain-containing protein, partial [Firmicutes bacterium]|nr:GerMN domain-containing protein [Bacillota bacterium]
ARREEQRRRWQAVADRNPDEVVLYFAGPTNGDDWLVPELRLVRGFAALPRTERIAVALRELARGPGPGSALLGVVPPGTRAGKVSLAPGLVTVDLTPEFGQVLRGGYTEALAVYAVVNTLAELVPECKVRLTSGGLPLDLSHLEAKPEFSPGVQLTLPGRESAGQTTNLSVGSVFPWLAAFWSSFSWPFSAPERSPSGAGTPCSP